MSDIVDSTALASERGEAGWRALLHDHDRAVRAAVTRFHGELLAHTGDGDVAGFDGPTRAMTCALRIADALADLGASTA